jgi:anti-anti-sigma factor
MDHTLTRIEPDPAGRPGIALLALRGDVDACDDPTLDALCDRLAATSQVHIDVAGVGFAGARLLGFLAALAVRARAVGGTLHLHGAPSRLVRLLALAGMGESFDVVPFPHARVLRWRPEVPAPGTDDVS